MPKVPNYKQLHSVLTSLGFKIIRQKGSHVQYFNGSICITIPKHSNREVSIGVFLEVLKKLNINKDQFWKI
ncbi:hypothetical protein A2903_02075 [Candidatus Nomurabacteria bacterium RIFCSPLOWO2_01_FULL_33_17]|uniref:Toxin HicA n=1 Tax=Candidatus Nomurabacteria bacterium RIFCSPLOWO2_01_FULL_33_17 TaxID=1801764 RepID=A0A1F6WPZ8_9BACT|nr:MAG: hypothetical protein A2903_02075 [Candidatus Nomurabacteria bacterium RIFCSPLOWO2_01_FULL_33_17]